MEQNNPFAAKGIFLKISLSWLSSTYYALSYCRDFKKFLRQVHRHTNDNKCFDLIITEQICFIKSMAVNIAVNFLRFFALLFTLTFFVYLLYVTRAEKIRSTIVSWAYRAPRLVSRGTKNLYLVYILYTKYITVYMNNIKVWVKLTK